MYFMIFVCVYVKMKRNVFCVWRILFLLCTCICIFKSFTDIMWANVVSVWSGTVLFLLLGESSDYAQPITGQVTEVTCPVVGRSQSNLPCDWPSIAWAYSEQETQNGTRTQRLRMTWHNEQEIFSSLKQFHFEKMSSFTSCFCIRSPCKCLIYGNLVPFISQNNHWLIILHANHHKGTHNTHHSKERNYHDIITNVIATHCHLD